MAAVKPVPDGHPTLTPYLFVPDGGAAAAFYRDAFGASERLRDDAPGGKIGRRWYISTHPEDVPPDEIARRAAATHGKAS